jgi:hypothetical protein
VEDAEGVQADEAWESAQDAEGVHADEVGESVGSAAATCAEGSDVDAMGESPEDVEGSAEDVHIKTKHKEPEKIIPRTPHHTNTYANLSPSPASMH